MKSMTVLTGILLALLFMTACGGDEGHSAEPTQLPSVRAAVERVEPAIMPLSFEAVGTVKSQATATLSSKMMGQVLGIHFKEGSLVSKGKLLVELDSREVAAQLEKAAAGLREIESALAELEQAVAAAEAGRDAAQANADLASSTYARFQTLLERKSVSQQEFDKAEAGYKAALAELQRAESMLASTRQKGATLNAREGQIKADLAGAEIFLSYSKIRAPFSGIVTSKQIEIGDLAAPGMPLLTLENNLLYRLEANIQESQFSNVVVGQKVKVLVRALEAEVEGTVAEVGAQMDAGSRSALVKINLPQMDQLRSGMFGRVHFPLGERRVMSISKTALVNRGQLTGAFVLDADGRARFRLLKLGKEFGDRIEVLSGLKERDAVVTELSPQLKDGTPVQSL
jgi:multidrug resistance efflux pump